MANIVNVGYDSTNYYVIEQNGIRMLVDVGWPGTLPKLKATLKRKGLYLSNIAYLFITHYHPDYAGLVQEIKNEGITHLVTDEQLEFIPFLKRYMKPNIRPLAKVGDGRILISHFYRVEQVRENSPGQ